MATKTELVNMINQQTELVQMILWLGGIIVSGLTAAVVTLWNANKKNENYIREQDKANLVVLSEIAKNYEIMSIDVSKLETMTSGEIKTAIDYIKNKIDIALNTP